MDARLHEACQAARRAVDRELAAEQRDDDALLRARIDYGRLLLAEAIEESIARAVEGGDQEPAIALICAFAGRDVHASTWEELQLAVAAEKLLRGSDAN